MKFIKFMIENESELDYYVFEFIFWIIGIKFQRIFDEKESLDIYYGKNVCSNAKINILKNEKDVIWKDLLENTISVEDINQTLNFDIINAIGMLITDKVNQNKSKESYDEHSCLLFNHSFQAKYKFEQIPLINIYVNFFKEMIQNKLGIEGIPLWPNNKKACIGLSHDVDIPDKYSIIKYFNFIRYHPRKLIKFIPYYKNICAMIRNYVKDKERNSYWLFNEIIDSEKKYGFKSTFFFASVNSYEKWGNQKDVSYTISNPNFKEIFKVIKNNDFDIGLHASYNAYKKLDNFKYEKIKLEKISNTKVKGLRHHYWHLGKNPSNTLTFHGLAGFEYDSSLAFNEEIGFRRNIALPYYPYDLIVGKKNSCMQLPVFCMDGSLFGPNHNDVESSRKLESYVKIIKKTGGIGVIDWHVRTSFPKNETFYQWGKLYLSFLEYLFSDPDIWVTSLVEINNWLREREDIMKLWMS